MKISQSKVKLFRRCKRAYYHKYVEQLKPKKKSRPLQFGTMIHEALERYFDGDEPKDYFDELEQDIAKMKLFAQERETYGDIVQDCRDIIESYVQYWAESSFRPVRIKGRGAEHHFEIELFSGVTWVGKIDMIVKTGDGLRWLCEHKTYTRKPGDDDRWRDIQSATYFRAMEILGWKSVSGCVWDYIKSKPPAIPGILKDGTLSTKKLDTLPSTVERVINQHDGDPGNTEALLAMAEKNMPEYFSRVFTPVNRAVADIVFEDFEASAKDMVEEEEKADNRWPMSIDKHCSWCDYESLCRSRLQNLDMDYVKERQYTHGKENDHHQEDAPVHKGTAF